MSANLDLVRSSYPAWGRDDYFGSTTWMHPEMEYVIADGPAPGHWTGLAAIGEAWRDILGVWDDLRIEAEAYARSVAIASSCSSPPPGAARPAD